MPIDSQPRRREFLAAAFSAAAHAASPPPSELRCEFLDGPLGIEEPRPRLSWILADTRRGAKQTAYRVLVASRPELLRRDEGDLWDSGKAASEEVSAEYVGKALASRGRCHWKVRVWDRDGRAGAWSGVALWTMGLLSPSDWEAKWIAVPAAASRGQSDAREWKRGIAWPAEPAPERVPAGPAVERWIGAGAIRATYALPQGTDGLQWSRERLEELQPAPMFRREFRVDAPVRRATLYACGLGFHELRLNGLKVGGRVMDPVETDYDRWACYAVHDVTALVKRGGNAIAAMLGDGWFDQKVAFTSPANRSSYGRLGLLAQLEIELADGTVRRVASGGGWKCTCDGPLLKNAVFAGELYDARLEMDGWDRAGFDDGKWAPAETVDPPTPRLAAQMAPSLRVVETARPAEVANPRPGVWVCDMGNLFTGWARLNAAAPRGTAVTLKYAETLGPDGLVYQPESLNVGAKSVDLYVCRGAEGGERWEPRFTCHSFRYVQVEGLETKPAPGAVEARFVSSAMPPALSFECSSGALNRLHRAFVRTGQTNSIHKWTDCPSREKTGWLSYPSYLVMMHNFQAHPFLMQLVRHTEAKTREFRRGGETYANVSRGIVLWRRGAWLPEQVASTVLLPWEMYLHYGDERVLRTHYPFMRDTIRYFAALAQDGVLDGDVGDWHDALPEMAGADRARPRPARTGVPDSFGGLADTRSIGSRVRSAERDGKRAGGGYSVHTHPAVVLTAHFHAAARVMEKAALLLGRDRESREYGRMAAAIRDGFLKRFYDPSERRFPSQTAYALALWQDLVPRQDKGRVIANLLREIEERKGRFTTGQLGTDRLVEALTDAGKAGVAFEMMMRRDYPGFGLMLDYGSGTTWETWGEAIVTQSPPGARAPVAAGRPLSHIQFTAVDAWLVQGLAGIRVDPEHPGFRRFRLDPQPIPQLSFVRARYRTARGTIVSSWRKEGRTFHWEVVIPAGTSAEMRLPARDASSARESGGPLSKAKGVRLPRVEEGRVVFQAEAGSYKFSSLL